MSKKVNIGRDNAGDVHYRYKRNRVEVRYSGKGKNSKTAIINLTRIAKQLYTTPDYISKFFGHRLATVSGIDSKCKEWFLKGRHTRVDIDAILDEFIEIFILCPECRKPETSLRVKKGVVRIRCYVCGVPGKLTDTTLLKYLAKHPQDDTKMYRAYARRKSAREALAAKAEMATELRVDTTGLPADEDVEWTTDVSDTAVKARAEGLSEAALELVQDESFNIDDI